jgi:hypothetical protein
MRPALGNPWFLQRSGAAIIALAVCCVLPSGLNAQEVSPAGPPREAPMTQTGIGPPSDRWFIAIEVGATSSGPAPDVEQAMRASGFGDTSHGFGGALAHPFSRMAGDRLPLALDLQYRVRGPWAVGFLLIDAPMRETFGYSATPVLPLSLHSRVRSVGAIAAWKSRAMRVGVGPAWHISRVRRSSLPFELWNTHSQLGLVTQVSMSLPVESRFYVDFGLQYHFVGRTMVSQHTFTSGIGPNLVFPATSVQFNHWFVGIGPGIRF